MADSSWHAMYGCSESKERLHMQPTQLFHCTRSVIWYVQESVDSYLVQFVQWTFSRCECNGLWQWTRRYQIPPTVRCEVWFGFCRQKMLDPVKFTEDLMQSMANMLWTWPVSENGAQYLGMGEQMFMTLRDRGDPLPSQTHWSKRWTASFGRINISQLAKCTNNVWKCLIQLCTKLSPNICSTAKFVQAAFWYEEGISKLVSRYNKCLIVQGDYVEK